MSNAFSALVEVLGKAQAPRRYATVASTTGTTSVVTLPGGGTLKVSGTAAVGTAVYVRAGVIESSAPAMTPVIVNI
jgi:hypothetical protein